MEEEIFNLQQPRERPDRNGRSRGGSRAASQQSIFQPMPTAVNPHMHIQNSMQPINNVSKIRLLKHVSRGRYDESPAGLDSPFELSEEDVPMPDYDMFSDHSRRARQIKKA